MKKVCRVCRCEFVPGQPMARVCSPVCALTFARSVRGKAEKVALVKEKRADAVKRQAQKSLGKLIAEAQTSFNAFIRLRDAGQPCICCGKPFEPQKPGGSADAGHFRSRGSAPHLRFDERNTHSQRKNCNRPGGAKHAAFRAGMIERIGLEALEALEADQTPRKYTRDDLVAIKADYAAKTRQLKKEAA